VALNSDADNFNLGRGDLIVSVNGFKVDSDLDKWLEYFGKEKQELGVLRNGKLGFVNIDPKFESGYKKYSIKHLTEVNENQEKNFKIWKNA